MRKFILMAGAAAMAAAMPVLAQGQGKGKGQGGNPAAEQRQGGGGQGKGAAKRAERQESRGQGQRAERSESRGKGQRAERREARGEDRRAERREARGEDRRAERPRQAERRDQREIRRAERPERADRDRDRQRDDAREQRRTERFAGDRIRPMDRDPREWNYGDRRGERWEGREFRAVPAAASGRHCPPGLAKKNAFCMPPGQLRKAQLIGNRHPVAHYSYNVPDRYQYRFRDADDHYYRYDEGFVYRFDRGTDVVSRVIPLYATGLTVGQPMPLGYDVYNLPWQYRSLYQDGGDHLYRYDDNAIYRVNSGNGLVESVVALLTSGALGGLGGLGVGDLLPSGYDAYNVPLDHRDTYYDSPDQLYRYADGNIYQVDPQTRLIEQIISLLT